MDIWTRDDRVGSRRPPVPHVALCVTEDVGPAVRSMVSGFGLETAGEVGRGLDAVGLAARVQPDAVILDLALAGEVGLKVISAIAAVAPRCRIIVVCAIDEWWTLALESGAHAVLGPGDLRDLSPLLADLIPSPA